MEIGSPPTKVWGAIARHKRSPFMSSPKQDHKENVALGDRLSWGDTIFLHLERDGMPLNVACVCIFEGEVAFQQCVEFVESKLPLIPRYLKRVVPAPFGIG